jgi:hypothetical protein
MGNRSIRARESHRRYRVTSRDAAKPAVLARRGCDVRGIVRVFQIDPMSDTGIHATLQTEFVVDEAM